MDEANMTEGQKTAKKLYECALGVVTKENAEGFVVAIISAAKVLGRKCPEDAAEISFLVGASMYALTKHIPANKMIWMLNPDNYDEMATSFLRKLRKEKSNEAG